MRKATLFNIQKFCTHDGPGIRTTVFFKGCPLHCRWCHNPESQSFAPQLLFNREACSGCGRCLPVCAQGAIRAGAFGMEQIMGRCVACGACADHCVQGCREVMGREYSVAEVLKEIEKDRPFYEQPVLGGLSGGVTFSGGEAACQIDFLAELAGQCRERDIHVALDTCGHVPWADLERIMPYTDLFLYDLKMMDPIQHQQYTGLSNELILDNLTRLAAAGARINLRLPLLEKVNTSEAAIDAVVGLIAPLPIRVVNLLPYHDIARHKYLRLGKEYHCFTPPLQSRLEEIQTQFQKLGCQVKIGG